MFCIKIYVLRNTSGFAQITQKIAQKCMRKRCGKVRNKNICAKITQILRNKYGNFVET